MFELTEKEQDSLRAPYSLRTQCLEQPSGVGGEKKGFKKEMEPNTAFGKALSGLPEFSSYHVTKTSRLIG